VNLQEYISSGIVESCVLGLASKQEQQEFEQYCAQYPELVAARESFELSLEKTALAAQVAPPEQVKAAVWNKIKDSATPSVLTTSSNADNPVIEMHPVIKPIWRYVAAASVILLVGSTLLNFYFYRQYQSYNARYDALFASTQQMADANKVLQTRNEELQSGILLMKDPGTLQVPMKGTTVSPASLATVYWNKKTTDVYMLVNSLPQPAADQQYQLWAFVDGRPVDAGFLDMQDTDGIVKMKNFARAEAFAITLEKKGRTDISVPAGQVYVLGKM
jgi:anti-sigma-K factor RskA